VTFVWLCPFLFSAYLWVQILDQRHEISKATDSGCARATPTYTPHTFERIDGANDFGVVPQLVAFAGTGFKAKVAGAEGVYGVRPR